MRANVSKVAMIVATLFITAATANMWLNDSDYSPFSLVVATGAAVLCWVCAAWELRR